MENSFKEKLDKLQKKKAEFERREQELQQAILKTKAKTLQKIYDSAVDIIKKNPQYEIEDLPDLILSLTFNEMKKERTSNKKLPVAVQEYCQFFQKGFLLLLKKNSIFNEDCNNETFKSKYTIIFEHLQIFQ